MVAAAVELVASRTLICHRTRKSSGSLNVAIVPAARDTNTDASVVPNRGCARANALLRRVPPLLQSPRLLLPDNGNPPCRDRELGVLVAEGEDTEDSAAVAEEDTEDPAAVAVVADEDHKCADSLPVPGDVGLVTVAAFLTASYCSLGQ